MKTNIFKYLKFLSITAFSSAVMFTAAFGACATTVDVGGKGMTSVGNLTGVSTNLIDPSSAVNVGTLGNATRQEVRFLAVPYASTVKFAEKFNNDKNLSDSSVLLYDVHKKVCGELNGTNFSLGKTNKQLKAGWAPLTMEAALALNNLMTIPPVKELNMDAQNNLISTTAVNYNMSNPLFKTGPQNAFGVSSQENAKNSQHFKALDRFKRWPNEINVPLSLGKFGGVYITGNSTKPSDWGSDWFPICYTTNIKTKDGVEIVDNGKLLLDVPLYWYPTLQ